MERQRINARHINADKPESAVICRKRREAGHEPEACRRRHRSHGQTGGAVVKSLLERGHEVRAVTRSTESAKARELANAGVTLVRASKERWPFR
jgi:hypothetical protein